MPEAGGISYREAGPADGPVALLVHGFPESSAMWDHVLGDLATAGWRGIALDLIGFGDSAHDRPATWANQVDALTRLHDALGLGPVALVAHDWGTLIGLRWACDHSDRVRALVISDGGFFPDGKWNALAGVLRTPGDGEALVENLDRDTLAAMLRAVCPPLGDEAIDAYWVPFQAGHGRTAALELYRSGDFSELAAYDGRLAAMDVPTLLLWGANDRFAPVAGAHRLAREIPHAELVVFDDLDHFVFDEDPARTSRVVVDFLAPLGPAAATN